MVQWFRICLAMQAVPVQSLVQEDSTCCQATKPMHHNHGACLLQLLKPSHPRTCVCVCVRACAHTCKCACVSSLNLCNPMGCSPPGSSVNRISQARVLEWVAISWSRGFSQPRDRTPVSCAGRRILEHCATWEALVLFNKRSFHNEKPAYGNKE